jgi:hypothetical protein
MEDGSDPADDTWRRWERAPDDASDDDGASDDGDIARAASSQTIYDPSPASATASDAPSDASAADDDAFAALLRMLRALPGPCAPPIGEGAFDILYASAREIVVWFVSAKDGIEQKEVAIPARLAQRAWKIMRRGEPVDEAKLRAIAAGASGGRWLLALFAQLPTVEVRSASASDDTSDVGDASHAVTLVWRGDPGAAHASS